MTSTPTTRPETPPDGPAAANDATRADPGPGGIDLMIVVAAMTVPRRRTPRPTRRVGRQLTQNGLHAGLARLETTSGNRPEHARAFVVAQQKHLIGVAKDHQAGGFTRTHDGRHGPYRPWQPQNTGGSTPRY
nr:hypothetical protein [Actinomadura spongiicola]